MKVTRFLKASMINLDLAAENKSEVVAALVRIPVEQGHLPGEMADEVVQAVMERESLTSTGLGSGVALPHVKTDAVSQICVAFGRSRQGIEFDALDGNPVSFFFLILAPTKVTDDYLKVLSSISGIMKNESVRKQILAAKSPDEVFKLLDRPV